MFPFTPSHIKHGRQFIKDARKLVAYKRDLVSEETVEEVNREIAHLEHAVAKKDRNEIGEQMKRLDEACGKLTKPTEDAAWRENVEVFLVAIVIALAVRTFFLQPFTIPTGSMQPTLNGIIATPGVEPPNIVSRAIQKVLFFRTYLNVVAQDDETILTMRPVKKFFIMDYTELESSKGNHYLVHIAADQLAKEKFFGLQLDRDYKKGDTILQGYYDTGDHVFVDKISYQFMRPQRDQVFVFSTHGIPRLTHEGQPSQYYIKRLAGLPNDDLRIDSPKLFINGHEAEGKGFARVMSGTHDNPENKSYRGYGVERDRMNGFAYLVQPDDHFQVPEKSYFPLGDNSYNSSDGRYFGPVPQENIAGRALFVYYPFTKHFGWIW